MSLNSNIKNLKEKIEPYHSLIFMIISFFGLLIGGYKIIVSPPDLSVKIKKDAIDYPSSINSKFLDVFNNYVDSIKSSKRKYELVEVHNYLINTKHHWEVTIKNETDMFIKGISIRVNNVASLTSHGVISENLLEAETTKILNSLKYEESSGIITLNEFANLPPKASITLIFTGVFNDYSLDEPVTVVYDGGIGKYEKTISVSGFKAYLSDYIFEIMILMILVFIFVFRFAVKR